MNEFLQKLLTPEVWMVSILANLLLFTGSLATMNFVAALLNASAGVLCYLGYLRAKKREGQ
jgi:hypothetical protein